MATRKLHFHDYAKPEAAANETEPVPIAEPPPEPVAVPSVGDRRFMRNSGPATVVYLGTIFKPFETRGVPRTWTDKEIDALGVNGVTLVRAGS